MKTRNPNHGRYPLPPPEDVGHDRRAARGAPHPSRAALGTTAKFPATRNHAGLRPVSSSGVNHETGEILDHERTASQCRLERYALQSVVRDLLPKSRTAKCLHYRQGNAAAVEVWRSVQHQRAHYKGLQTCSSVWACPVCAAKISERRRVELQQLIASHEAAGGVVLLNTRTTPHKRTDDLAHLLGRIGKADDSYKAHRGYKALLASFGLVGTVRAVEVTYGHSNGWHPHIHELMFFSGPVDVPALEDALSGIWTAAALRAGLDAPSRAHGLTLQDGSYAAKYASKWGLESELTQWHRKRGKIESRTPFDLLRDVIGNDDAHAAQLFIQYAQAFHGRHQLQFSRGLKHRYQIADISDAALAARIDDDAVRLGALSSDDWRLIVKLKQRASVLEVASMWGWEGVEVLLAGLRRALDRGGPS